MKKHCEPLLIRFFLFVSISQFSPGEAQMFHLHESMWWIALPLCTYRKHYETHCTMASMWRNTHIYFWGNGLLYGEWMIKPLIAVLWPEEVLGIDGTFQSSETPTAILHYYWSKAHGTALIPHTNKNSKNTSVPLKTYAAARTQTDQQISSPHVQIHARQKNMSPEAKRQLHTKAHKSVKGDTLIHCFAWLTPCQSVCLSRSLYLNITVSSAPGYHCQPSEMT